MVEYIFDYSTMTFDAYAEGKQFENDTSFVDEVPSNKKYFDPIEGLHLRAYVPSGFKYYIDDEIYPIIKEKEEFKPKGKDILIDILSSEKVNAEDLVGMNLIITNTTGKNVDVKVFEDEDKRVQIIYK